MWGVGAGPVGTRVVGSPVETAAVGSDVGVRLSCLDLLLGVNVGKFGAPAPMRDVCDLLSSVERRCPKEGAGASACRQADMQVCWTSWQTSAQAFETF